MKKLLTTIFLLSLFPVLNAQMRYQGDIGVGYGIGVGEHRVDKFIAKTVHGLRFNPYFFAGVGVGMEIGTSDLTYDDDWAFNKPTSLQIYLNLKGYYPLNNKISLYVSGDVGYGNYSENETGKFEFGENNQYTLGYSFKGKGGIYFAPQLGCNLKLTKVLKLDLSLGYYAQRYKYDFAIWDEGSDPEYSKMAATTGTLALKVGFVW